MQLLKDPNGNIDKPALRPPDATDILLREKRQTSPLSVNITGIQARLAFGMGLCATEPLGTTAQTAL